MAWSAMQITPTGGAAMTIELKKEQRKDVIQSIEQSFREEQEDEICEMGAGLRLDYFLKEIAPLIYNEGVAHVQRYFIEKTEDLTGSLFVEEFGYWYDRKR
jgi:uncharacterized protein (DUF2164 family)